MAQALIQWPVEPQGTVKIIREANKTYTVEHSDLYRVYSRVEGFRTFKAAKREADIFRR